jgi:hypothetical protein
MSRSRHDDGHRGEEYCSSRSLRREIPVASKNQWQKTTLERWNELRAKARTGDPEAQWWVGDSLEDGLTDADGVVLAKPNARAAVRWFRKSASAGNASGQIRLGVCLSSGCGVRRDDAEALKWYKRALRQADICAPNNIAILYRNRGNHRRAMFWFHRALAVGGLEAWVDLGRAYWTGVGVKRDADRAVRCFRNAIASDGIFETVREDAMFLLGVAYYEGCGVKKSNALALKWLSRANQDDDRPAARGLIERIAMEGRE